MRKIRSLLFGLVVLPSSLFGAVTLTAAEAPNQTITPDVRLLIDISGSMKQNDPQNLRIPALQLVTNLMPKGADAGVWAFGRYVNMMVPIAPVDEQWQQKATATAAKINSAGLFTNIGGVLEKASYGWSSVNPKEKRSLILLTDGMVDISKDAKVNAKERQRILNNILPKLVKAKVIIHTIALSQNADHDLLKTLSSQTDGWYQAVDNPQDLQKTFLKIFEQSAARDSLPLTNNQFKVDASVEEMTLLVFKANPKDKTRLQMPDKTWLEETTNNNSMRWFSTDGYDLITMQAPTAGDWKIDGAIDPDNRVLVVSNLKLQVSDVPNNLLAGEAINYQALLLEAGKVITKSDFLKLVKAELQQKSAKGSQRLAMFFDESNHRFQQNFFTDDFEGILDLTLHIKSPTFERTRQHAVNVYGSPIIHEIKVASEAAQSHQLFLSLREDIVTANTVQAEVKINLPNGQQQLERVKDFTQPINITNLPQGGDYSVTMQIAGQSKLGRQFSVSSSEIIFTVAADIPAVIEPSKTQTLAVETIEEPLSSPAEQPAQQQETKAEETKAEEEKPADVVIPTEKEAKNDGALWLYIGLGANVLLVLLGFFVWKLLKKKKQQGTNLLADELGIEEDENDDESAGSATTDKSQEEKS